MKQNRVPTSNGIRCPHRPEYAAGAYLDVYSGYRASSIAALIPAIEGSLTRIVSDLDSAASVPDKIDHAIDRAIRTAAELHFEGMWGWQPPRAQ